MNAQNEKTGKPVANDRDITVIVKTTRGDKTYTFPKTTKIAEVISQTVKDCGFAPGDRYELVRDSDKTVLQQERTLVSYHIEDGTVLILSSIGSGV